MLLFVYLSLDILTVKNTLSVYITLIKSGCNYVAFVTAVCLQTFACCIFQWFVILSIYVFRSLKRSTMCGFWIKEGPSLLWNNQLCQLDTYGTSIYRVFLDTFPSLNCFPNSFQLFLAYFKPYDPKRWVCIYYIWHSIRLLMLFDCGSLKKSHRQSNLKDFFFKPLIINSQQSESTLPPPPFSVFINTLPSPCQIWCLGFASVQANPSETRSVLQSLLQQFWN